MTLCNESIPHPWSWNAKHLEWKKDWKGLLLMMNSIARIHPPPFFCSTFLSQLTVSFLGCSKHSKRQLYFTCPALNSSQTQLATSLWTVLTWWSMQLLKRHIFLNNTELKGSNYWIYNHQMWVYNCWGVITASTSGVQYIEALPAYCFISIKNTSLHF